MPTHRCALARASGRRSIPGNGRRGGRWPCTARRWTMYAQRPEMVPSVAVVVLNWNGTDDTLQCLDSLMRITYPRCEIVVVDNGSRPSPRQRVATGFPGVRYLETGLNLGYAGGNNVGIRD